MSAQIWQKNFRLSLNLSASHSPFWSKLWMPLATIYALIFWKEKKQKDRGWKNIWTDKREIWNSYLDRYVCTLMAEFFPVIKYRPEEINQFSGCKTLSMTCWRSCAILWFGALAQVIFFKISVPWFEIQEWDVLWKKGTRYQKRYHIIFPKQCSQSDFSAKNNKTKGSLAQRHG